MPVDNYQIAWNLFLELRKELVESQKIRAQIIGFKITFVTASIGLIASNPGKIPAVLLALPAFAAIFFDLLATSYSFSIKRIGHYCRNHVEPLIRKSHPLPARFLLWQEFLSHPKTAQRFSFSGNMGITSLALLVGVIGLFNPYRPILTPFLLVLLIAFFAYDLKAYWSPRTSWRLDVGDGESTQLEPSDARESGTPE